MTLHDPESDVPWLTKRRETKLIYGSEYVLFSLIQSDENIVFILLLMYKIQYNLSKSQILNYCTENKCKLAIKSKHNVLICS